MELRESAKIKLEPHVAPKVRPFFQAQLDRLYVGKVRYSRLTLSERKYMTRIKLELAKYKDTGNAEYLINIANYALLETTSPENKKFHYNNKAESATRGKV